MRPYKSWILLVKAYTENIDTAYCVLHKTILVFDRKSSEELLFGYYLANIQYIWEDNPINWLIHLSSVICREASNSAFYVGARVHANAHLKRCEWANWHPLRHRFVNIHRQFNGRSAEQQPGNEPMSSPMPQRNSMSAATLSCNISTSCTPSTLAEYSANCFGSHLQIQISLNVYARSNFRLRQMSSIPRL